MSKDSPKYEQGLIRLKTVLEMIPISRSTWWAGVKEGKYPKPLHFGKKIRVWQRKDIQALIDNLIAQPSGENSHAGK